MDRGTDSATEQLQICFGLRTDQGIFSNICSETLRKLASKTVPEWHIFCFHLEDGPDVMVTPEHRTVTDV